MRHFIIAALVFGLSFLGQAHASPPSVDTAAEQKIRNSLKILLPGLVPDSVRTTPMEGFYEVAFGTRLVYISADGRFLLQGKVIDLETREEITDKRLAELKRAAMAKVSEDDMVIYEPKVAKDTVTVFTDVDCGFCRKLHSEMDQYLNEGIRVRYLFYPRAGIGSDSYNKAVSVWCADDQHQAMDDAKAGKSIEKRSCQNPVSDQYALGQSMQIRGTPALVLDDGEVLPGYVPAKKLRRALDQRAKSGGS